ncbi:hypothetical protein ACG2F4_07460 [Halalkalibaculum sp. DA3122]|uniref:hypothetical protein n=1 Tax=Halalkalibaculum sp. DA3122 TaxID=3373607 RepID=UPI003753FC73
MERDHNVQKKVDQAMHSWDGIKPAQTDDFFYARLEEKLSHRQQAVLPQGWNPRFSLALAAALVLVFFNIWTVLEYDQAYGANETDRQQSLEAFAEDYLLDIPTIYELNSEE